MKSYYLIDSKDLMEMADNIKDAGGLTFSLQEFTISNYMQDPNNNNEYGYTWYRIIYGGSSQPSPGYSFSVELEGALATDVIQINSISSAFNYDIQVEAYRNYNNTKDIISVIIYSGENEVSGECTITGTLYHTGTGTGTVTIPAGETSAGEAPSNKLEWPNGFISAINNLPSINAYGLVDLFSMSEFTCLASFVKSFCFYGNEMITSVNLPNCQYVDRYCFAYCFNLSQINLLNCSLVDYFAFQNCSNLSQINLFNCNKISGHAFDGCLSLNSISLPNCEIIEDGAFYNCGLLSISLPKCKSIGQNIFYNTNISEVYLPIIKSLPGSAFYGCGSLTNISIPECEHIAMMCFKGCTMLSEINFSKVEDIQQQAFEGCTNLTTVNLPNCQFMNTDVFRSCTNLCQIELPNCSTFWAKVFSDCHNLLSLYLMNSQVVNLIGDNWFYHTPIAGYSVSTSQQGYIYVPSSLYNDYIIASGWSDYANYIVGV